MTTIEKTYKVGDLIKDRTRKGIYKILRVRPPKKTVGGCYTVVRGNRDLDDVMFKDAILFKASN